MNMRQFTQWYMVVALMIIGVVDALWTQVAVIEPIANMPRITAYGSPYYIEAVCPQGILWSIPCITWIAIFIVFSVPIFALLRYLEHRWEPEE